MHVFAVETVGEFIGVRFADHARAGVEEPLHARRGLFGRRMRLEPDRVAVAGAMPCDIVDVLHRHGEPGERACAATIERDVGVTRERVERVVRDHCGLCSLAG